VLEREPAGAANLFSERPPNGGLRRGQRSEPDAAAPTSP